MTDTPKPPGRPLTHGERLVPFNLYVTPTQRDWLRKQANASQLIRQMIEKEMSMNTTFATRTDAIAAGYRPVNRKADTDTSGPGSFGYNYQDADGNETVTVWLTEERNKLGKPGCFVPMYPPK